MNFNFVFFGEKIDGRLLALFVQSVSNIQNFLNCVFFSKLPVYVYLNPPRLVFFAKHIAFAKINN